MPDFINVTNEVAKATIAAAGSATLHVGKSLLADGIVYASDGVNWDPVTTGDFTAATLPDPSNLPNGWCVGVADYNGNIATVVNGGWKFNFPFKTNWSAKPPASVVPIGSELIATDYRNRKWTSNGSIWTPNQGVMTLYSLFGLNDGVGQVAQLSGITSGIFAIPGNLKIPAGMIPANSKVSIQTIVTKVGGNGTAVCNINLGTSGTSSDPKVSGMTISIATGTQYFSKSSARFGSSTTKFNTQDYLGDGISQAGSAGIMQDRVTNIDTTQDMYITVSITAANSADIFNLIGIQIKLES